MTDDTRQPKLKSVADATLIVDHDLRIVDRNQAAIDMFCRGSKPVHVLGDLFAGDAAETVVALRRLLEQRGTFRAEVPMRAWTGGTFSADVSVSRFRLEDTTALQVNVHDIMHRKRNEEQLRHVATHDSLTDLPNRLALLDRLGEHIANRRSAALLWFGVDGFKLINDSLGYRAGDELLVTLGDRIVDWAGDESSIAHLGGDHFAYVLDNCADLAEAVERAHDLAATVARPVELGRRPLYITGSIGIALYRDSHADAEDWLADAEIALFRAKRRGRGQIVVFEANQRTQVAAQLDLENELHRAIDQDEFELHYQPIVALDDRQLVAFEALVRWRSPRRGLLLPGDFLPTMARAGMQATLDRIVLHAAIKQLAQWNADYGETAVPRLHVNVSSERFVGEGLIGELDTLLEKSSVAPTQIELEITEGTLFEFPDHVGELLARLKAAGVRVALDDFGTGFSSLSYLQQYPVDALKIDRSFVNVATRSTAILRALVMLGDALGMDLVAEGIESEEELTLVRDLGCDYGQGFHIARPLPATDATRWLLPPEPYADQGSQYA